LRQSARVEYVVGRFRDEELVVVCPAPASVEEGMRRADAAFYRAKRDGRKRVSGLGPDDSASQSARQKNPGIPGFFLNRGA